MIMPAPGRFSITTGLLHKAASFAATTRAVVSIEPPGAVGTTTRTMRSGKALRECRLRNRTECRDHHTRENREQARLHHRSHAYRPHCRAGIDRLIRF